MKIVLVTAPTKEEVPAISEALKDDFAGPLQREYFFFILPPYIEAETPEAYKQRLLDVATALITKYKKKAASYVR